MSADTLLDAAAARIERLASVQPEGYAGALRRELERFADDLVNAEDFASNEAAEQELARREEAVE